MLHFVLSCLCFQPAFSLCAAQGSAGIRGPPGPPGPNGAKGDAGARGDQGARGIIGDQVCVCV